MRWPRRILIGLLALLALFYGLGGWHFSNVLDERALDGAAMRASYPGEYDLTVTRVGQGTIGLAPIDEAPTALNTDGEWGLRWEDGYGSVHTQDGTHALDIVEGDPPRVGDEAMLDPRWYPDVGHMLTRRPVQNVQVPGPLGSYPAWYWPGTRHAWAIVVHGNSMTRLDGARAVPIFAGMGFPVLVPTYRNDPGAPEDPSGKLRYGLTEWQDLEAAVRYAMDHGATDVILDGYSMGGGVIMAFMERSELADRVTAIVMDAPMLDFGQTVDDNASRETLPVVGLPLPSSLTVVAKQLAAIRFDVNWKALNYLGTDPGVPTLIFHGTQDLTVPISTSIDFARRYSDVTLERCPGAGHIECWNVDPDRYDWALGHFLRENAREEVGVLSCPPGSTSGGATMDGARWAPSLEEALASQDAGAGTVEEIPIPQVWRREADLAYLLVREGFPVRLYLIDREGSMWAVTHVSFCGDVGLAG